MNTSFFCPSRHTRPMACWSSAGFQLQEAGEGVFSRGGVERQPTTMTSSRPSRLLRRFCRLLPTSLFPAHLGSSRMSRLAPTMFKPHCVWGETFELRQQAYPGSPC